MHINRKPGEQIEVDWAGDPAYIIDSETGEQKKAYVFVGVLNYSRYAYAKAFLDEKKKSWNDAHIHMFEFFGVSTWIIAALRNEEFFSIDELNHAIRKKLVEYNEKPFQKKEGSRKGLFDLEERTFLLPLPRTRYENAFWRSFTVQFNYHICVDGIFYSVPFSFIGKKVDVRETNSVVEIFDNGNRIASHARLLGCKGKYSTSAIHMPEKHQKFLEWDGDRFRSWARKIGYSTLTVIERVLDSKPIEQQAYKGCMAILSLEKDYSGSALKKGSTKQPQGITRGADYYRRNND